MRLEQLVSLAQTEKQSHRELSRPRPLADFNYHRPRLNFPLLSRLLLQITPCDIRASCWNPVISSSSSCPASRSSCSPSMISRWSVMCGLKRFQGQGRVFVCVSAAWTRGGVYCMLIKCPAVYSVCISAPMKNKQRKRFRWNKQKGSTNPVGNVKW